MASKEAQEYLAQVKAYQEAAIGAAGAAPTLEEMRAGSIAVLETVGTMPDGVSIEEVDVDGMTALWCRPKGAPADSVVLYFHGGGYVLQSAQSHRKLTSHLAVQGNRNVLSVNYRLAPEHPHPAAIEDAMRAYKWLLAKGYAASRIAVSGDSMNSKAGVDLMVQRHALQLMASMFVAGGSFEDPLAAPLHGDFSGVAPLYIQVGGDETLLDDSTRIATKAAHAGVPVRLEVFPEMQHVFQAAVGMIPEATDAVAKAGAWLREILA